MGDKGKKDKEKGQKQHAAKDKQEDKRKLEKHVAGGTGPFPVRSLRRSS